MGRTVRLLPHAGGGGGGGTQQPRRSQTCAVAGWMLRASASGAGKRGKGEGRGAGLTAFRKLLLELDDLLSAIL